MENNSLSNHIKYTLPEVKAMLEEREIFFKKNWLTTFYHLNSSVYRWKYDPILAADAYIRLHPEALRGETKESNPPNSAPPPKVAQISKEYAKQMREDGAQVWAAFSAEIRAAVPPDIAKHLDSVTYANAYKCGKGYFAWAVQLVFATYNDMHDFGEAMNRRDDVGKAMAKHHIASVKYTTAAEQKAA